MKKIKTKITILGLGYVGLPLALEFSKYFSVVGFDINKGRVKELRRGRDNTNEIINLSSYKNDNLSFTYNTKELVNSKYYIITVPTPVNKKNEPDLKLIKAAAKTVGSVISKNAVVILESTVYPGVTENIIGKIIEKISGLRYLKDFNLAYSPERINPGDNKYKITNIKKVVAADNENVLNKIANLYGMIVKAGVYKASSIKVAEMSKAIENAQRDINIAFINEVAMISKEIGVNSSEVLKAARTKWNFLDFKPGLVGGRCIGVDPYYLAKAALSVGYDPEIILAGRKINDQMPSYICKIIKKYIENNSKILMLGLTFKENVKDIRNSKSATLAYLFADNGYAVEVYDPVADKKQAFLEYGIRLKAPRKKYNCIIVSVAHREFLKMSEKKIVELFKNPSLLINIKNIWNEIKLPNYISKWSL